MATQPNTPPNDPHELDMEDDSPSGLDFLMTYSLLGILAVIHFYQMNLSVMGRIEFIDKYALNNAAVANGEYYRLFTAMFLHADLTHIIMNGLGLYFFGQAIESLFGRARFLAIYVLGGLTGSIASFMITDGNSIGASGAVLALFGAVAAYYIRNRKLYGKEAAERLRSLAVVAALNLLIGFASYAPGSNVRIDNAAHIGGALGGMLLGLLCSPVFELRQGITPTGRFERFLVDTTHPTRWIAYIAGFAVGLFALLMLGLSVA